MGKYVVGLFLLSLTLVASEEFQELTLDKLKNKKVIEMSLEEFEALKKREENLKKQREYTKALKEEAKKFQKEEIKEIVMHTGNTLEESSNIVKTESKENIKKPEEKTSLQKEPVLKSGVVAEIEALELANAVSYFLNKHQSLTVFEFEQSKNVILEKIKKDKRFDMEMVDSIGVQLMNKNQFLNFLSDLKISIINR